MHKLAEIADELERIARAVQADWNPIVYAILHVLYSEPLDERGIRTYAGLPLETVIQALPMLESYGLVENVDGLWHLTDHGRSKFIEF